MFFYLEWIDKIPTRIELLEEKKPSRINFESVFSIKKREYVICGYINPM